MGRHVRATQWSANWSDTNVTLSPAGERVGTATHPLPWIYKKVRKSLKSRNEKKARIRVSHTKWWRLWSHCTRLDNLASQIHLLRLCVTAHLESTGSERLGCCYSKSLALFLPEKGPKSIKKRERHSNTTNPTRVPPNRTRHCPTPTSVASCAWDD